MHALVTGAGGFVGRALVQRLLHDIHALPRPLSLLTVIDQDLSADDLLPPPGLRLRRLQGDIGDPRVWNEALSPAPELVYHLASLPGSRAEQHTALGLQANLLAPINLFQRVAALSAPARVVFASSIAVYGALPTSGRIDENAPSRPVLSYGAHKRMTEILLADLSRRGEIDAVSLRLPGIVARPSSSTGHGSAFMSDLIHRLSAGEPYQCPVSPRARAWWMSLACCVDNLLHAAGLDTSALDADRTVQLPVLDASITEIVAAIERMDDTRPSRPARISYRPDERIEAWFGRIPPLDSPQARQLGFRDDGSLNQLLHNALAWRATA